MNKEQVSDLRSLHDSVVARTVEYEKASQALTFAKNKLDVFLWNEEQKGKQ